VETDQNFDKTKPSGFLLFYDFYTILHFDEFCRVRDFKFFNSIFTKNLEMNSSFFEFFTLIFLFFWKFQIWPTGFRENIFE
jgi:hypothetical protein